MYVSNFCSSDLVKGKKNLTYYFVQEDSLQFVLKLNDLEDIRETRSYVPVVFEDPILTEEPSDDGETEETEHFSISSE